MKKYLLLLSILILTITGFTQSNTGINICGIKESKPNVITLSLDQLIECSELTANNEHLTIVSFLIAMITSGGDVRTIKNSGNKFSEKMIESIKKHNPSKFYIEKIELSSKKGTIQYAGAVTIKLKK